MIVPGGGISLDDTRWVSCRPGFFLPVRVLSRLFRRLFLSKLLAAHQAGHLAFFGGHAALAKPQAFAAFLAPLRKTEWVCDVACAGRSRARPTREPISRLAAAPTPQNFNQGLHFGEALDCDRDAKWTMLHAWRLQRWSTPRRA